MYRDRLLKGRVRLGRGNAANEGLRLRVSRSWRRLVVSAVRERSSADFEFGFVRDVSLVCLRV